MLADLGDLGLGTEHEFERDKYFEWSLIDIELDDFTFSSSLLRFTNLTWEFLFVSLSSPMFTILPSKISKLSVLDI